MKEMIILLAASLSYEEIVEKIKDVSSTVSIIDNERNRQELLFYAHVLTLHVATKGDLKSALGLIKDMHDHENKVDIFKTSNN